MSHPLVSFRDVYKSYGSNRVLTGVNFQVDEGSVVALLGPNGAGKTTAVSIASTLVRPDSGVVEVAGHDVVRDPASVRDSISVTGQFAAVDDLLTGRENLVMMARLHRVPRCRITAVVEETLARFGLSDAAGRRVGTYSVGMRRRLDIAISMLARPRVLFLDEPTTGLDPRSRQGVWDFVRELVNDGVSVLLTTQYLEEADQLADHVVVLDHGRIIADGTANELKRQVGTDLVDVQFADGSTRSIATDGSLADLRRILDILNDGTPDVVTVAVRSPSLDDVFLAITGQAAGPEPSERAINPTGGAAA